MKEECKMSVQWIWLNPIVYPEFQKNEQRIFWPKICKDCVVDFKKKICFLKSVGHLFCCIFFNCLKIN